MDINDQLLEAFKERFPDNFVHETTLEDALKADDTKLQLQKLLSDFTNMVACSYKTIENKELLCEHIKDLIVGLHGQTPKQISERILTVLERTEDSLNATSSWLNKIIDAIDKPLASIKTITHPDVLYPFDKKTFISGLNAYEAGFFDSVYNKQHLTSRDLMSDKQYNFMNKLCLRITKHRFEELVFCDSVKDEVIDDSDTELD